MTRTTPLQRSAITRARADRRAAARARADHHTPRPRWRAWLDALVATIAVVSAITLVGLASYYWHSSASVPQCLATSYDDCE